MSEKLSDEQIVVILNRMAEVLRGIGADDPELQQVQYDDGSWSRTMEPTVRRRAEQGEPSDAQVEVAWRVWLGLEPDEAVMGHWIHEARLKARAALRAAWGER